MHKFLLFFWPAHQTAAIVQGPMLLGTKRTVMFFSPPSSSECPFSMFALILSRSLHLMESNEGPAARSCPLDTNIHASGQGLPLFFTVLPLCSCPRLAWGEVT